MSLKQALLKAGLKSSKTENMREQKPKKEKTKIEKHQEHRNFCEVCECIQPDVELFKHRNRLITAEWICVNCADKNEILDEFRVTQQSEFSRTKRYRRYYGPMKDFSKTKSFGPKNREASGNRSPKTDPNSYNKNKHSGRN